MNFENSSRDYSAFEFENYQSFSAWFESKPQGIEWMFHHEINASENSCDEIGNKNSQKKGRPRVFEWTRTLKCLYARTPKSGRMKENYTRGILKPSWRLGCKAQKKVQEKLGCEEICVSLIKNHTRHGIWLSVFRLKMNFNLLMKNWLGSLKMLQQLELLRCQNLAQDSCHWSQLGFTQDVDTVRRTGTESNAIFCFGTYQACWSIWSSINIKSRFQ